MESTKLEISGMTCSHCVSAVRNALTSIDGVNVGEVSIGSAEFSFDPAKASLEQIKQAIEEEGYPVGPTQLRRASKGPPVS